MKDQLVSRIYWWKKNGRWTCSLILYDDAFHQLWLESGVDFSFKIESGRYCIGFMSTSPKKRSELRLESWMRLHPCPFQDTVNKGLQCSLCSMEDTVNPCLMCNGRECLTDNPDLKNICENSIAYVYLASFGKELVKVGVAHESRIPQRWVEQGANIAKRILIGNGIEVRKYEDAIHKSLRLLIGLRTTMKIDTLWKRDINSEILALKEVEEEIQERFPDLPYYQDSYHNLDEIYKLPNIENRPIKLNIKKNVQISGKILGVKGSLLLLDVKDIPHFINLRHLMGRRIKPQEGEIDNIQTILDRF